MMCTPNEYVARPPSEGGEGKNKLNVKKKERNAYLAGNTQLGLG